MHPERMSDWWTACWRRRHYGERWGRHWLDVAGYADSEGYTNDDLVRPYVWKYRDYVIRAFNNDMPWDQFIREQLAGDEMVKLPNSNLKKADQEKTDRDGFLALGAGRDGCAGRRSENGSQSSNGRHTANRLNFAHRIDRAVRSMPQSPLRSDFADGLLSASSRVRTGSRLEKTGAFQTRDG